VKLTLREHEHVVDVDEVKDGVEGGDLEDGELVMNNLSPVGPV